MKVNADFTTGLSFIANMNINCLSAQEGWSLYFGSGSGASFHTGFGFYGRSGYIFDSDDNFFGGFSENQPFEIKAHVFNGDRASYFFQNALINNNLPVNGSISSIEFDKNGESFVSISYYYGDATEVFQDSGAPTDAILYNGEAILYNGQYVLFDV